VYRFSRQLRPRNFPHAGARASDRGFTLIEVLTTIAVMVLVMPPIVLILTVTNPLHVLAAAPARAEIIALATGFIWGFGAILFGLGVSAIGISMANTLVLATSASLNYPAGVAVDGTQPIFSGLVEFLDRGKGPGLDGGQGHAGCDGCSKVGRHQRDERHSVDSGAPDQAGFFIEEPLNLAHWCHFPAANMRGWLFRWRRCRLCYGLRGLDRGGGGGRHDGLRAL